MPPIRTSKQSSDATLLAKFQVQLRLRETAVLSSLSGMVTCSRVRWERRINAYFGSATGMSDAQQALHAARFTPDEIAWLPDEILYTFDTPGDRLVAVQFNGAVMWQRFLANKRRAEAHLLICLEEPATVSPFFVTDPADAGRVWEAPVPTAGPAGARPAPTGSSLL